MGPMRVALAGLALALAPVHAKSVDELTKAYTALMNSTCATAVKGLPALPTADQAAFMSVFQTYGNNNVTWDDSKLNASALKVLENPAVAAFLAPAHDSFGAGGLDYALSKCAVLRLGTPALLANFSAGGAVQENTVSALFANGPLMRDMLLAGSPEGVLFGQAAYIYGQIKQSDADLQLAPVGADALWDDRSNKTVLHRLALSLALALAKPLQESNQPQTTFVDPVVRYAALKAAYLAGDLDPYFEVLTVGELRWAVPFDGSESDLAWLRETMGNYRPDHFVDFEYGFYWRYARAVRTEVAYGDSVWPDGVHRWYDLPAAGGVCGPRAFFGRFTRRAFGLPAIKMPETGHGAMMTWGPGGWTSLLGMNYSHGHTVDSLGDRGGSDFVLEQSAKEFRPQFQQVLRASWAALALEETPVTAHWTRVNPETYTGTGGNWSTLAFAGKISAAGFGVPFPSRYLGESVVPTKTASIRARWNDTFPAQPATVGPDGSITVPAASFSWKNTTAFVNQTHSFHDVNATQVLLGHGNFTQPEATAFEYKVNVTKAGTYFLVLNFTTWHVNTDLILSVNGAKVQAVPVFYTTGYWKETQPLAVTLVAGTNTLRFMRQMGAYLTVKEFFLLTSKPSTPLPPANYTPAPEPPPVDRYIKLRPHLTCTSQGILDLDSTECGYASQKFGFDYTGPRGTMAWAPGCWGLTSGPWAGNSNLNVNASGLGVPDGIVAMCLRS